MENSSKEGFMSKQEERRPSIRFKGYTEPWEQRKLGDVGETKSGVGFPDNEQGGIAGVPFYKVSDMNNIGNEIEMVTSNNYVTQAQIDSRKWKVIDNVPAIMFAKVGAALLLNRKRLIREPFLIDNNTMVYIPSAYWDIMFCKILFDTLNLSKYSQVGALPSYNGSDIEAIHVFLPTLPEQRAIGSFFQELNQLITLQQRELELMKEGKKTLLSKMFPKDGENFPEIRFPGFTDAWEQRKFKDLSSKGGKRNSSGNEYPVYSVSNQSGLIPQSEQFEGSRLDTLDKNSYKIVEPNDFVYNPARINVGSIAFNHLRESIIVSSLYVIFSLNRSVDNRFALQFIKSDDFIKEVRKNTEGSVREYLFYENFSNIRLPLPPTLSEQTAIGFFFQELDQLITLQQRELEILKTMKSTLLKAMFA